MAVFAGKVVFITGATSNIGEAVARRLASSGCVLAMTGREQDELMELARQCQRLGASKQQMLLLAGDLTDRKNLEEAVKRTVEKFGKVDILVNNMSWESSFDDMSPAALFDETMSTNVRSVIYLIKLLLPHLIETQGCIINNYNIPNFTSSTDKVIYNMTKLTVDQFMRSIAVDLAQKGIRVNSVDPGALTDSRNDFSGHSISQMRPPPGKHSKDKAVAAAIGWLASCDAAMITGELLTIDGGRRIMPGAPKE